MNPHDSVLQGCKLVVAALLAVVVLTGCSGDDGAPGPAGPPGEPGSPGLGFIPVSSATELAISITGVTINSAPVVNFSVINEDGLPVGGITTSDLRFTLAKLKPAANGSPSAWQSYIVRTETATVGPGSGTTMVQATRDQDGTLVDNQNGTYTYTFKTDITNVACPAPCTDAEGNALDLSYQPDLTHRLGIQTRGSLPVVNSTYDFRPDGNPITTERDIVKTANCNECHNELEAHDARVETKYCVTCHNPGSTDANSGNTVDFKVMIHKLHRGEFLPSVVAGGEYAIWGFNDTKHDYSDVAFPQDIRNCTKCHDGSDSDTPQGDAWQTPSMAACGSCHDDVDFSNHNGVAVTDIMCQTCHREDGTGFAKSAAEAHVIPTKVASANFQYNILTICGAAVDASPVCAPGTTPTVTFSVSDPTGATDHGYGSNYDVAGPTPADRDPEFDDSASLNILTAWDTRDYTNEDGAGSRPSRADSLSALTNAVDNTDGTFTITLAAIPATATGSGAIAIEGHPRGETVVGSGTFDISVPVKGEVAYFAITDATPVARRVAVDVTTKCNNCHDQLSLHGNNRAENAQLCVLCHNPRGTDVAQRPKTVAGIPDTGAALDGKREESIDLKRLIHAIHAAQKDDPSTPEIEGHGFREKGIVIYGYGGNAHDFGHVRFPGILNDCTTCHNAGTYELTGKWETPTQNPPTPNDILASSMETVPTATDVATYDTEIADQTNDLTNSPTAAVCSACHDSSLAKVHMEDQGGAQFNVLQSEITGRETCSICHGPGKIADVKVVHGVE
ncbi:MAG: OmcA/MtrC family decaheme c-type cytochrome [Gammaproteobacteria bacterium]